MRLTATTIRTISLPPGKLDKVFFDSELPGFGLRVRASGAKTWMVQYAIGGRTRRIVLGPMAVLDVGKARATAKDILAKVRLGHDPAGEKAESRARAVETMAAALQSYLPHQRARLKPLSYVQMERHLLKHCRPLHGAQLAKIDRRAVASRVAAIATKSGPVEANRVSASLAAFFAWCIREGLTDSNPVVGTGRRPERSRERVLDDAELKAIWATTADARDYSAIVRLLMLTGQRLAEIGGLCWSEIDGDRILLPAARTKNARAHPVPLTGAARAILDNRPRRPDRDFVFGRERNRPFTGYSVSKAALDAQLGTAMLHWTHHDLRRTMSTVMHDKLGIAPHVVEAVLNHVSGHKHGVAGTYNRASYETQKRHALTAWADHLLAIVEGRGATATVVPLRGA